MRVLVTGASGVFGRDVVRRLALEGHEVIGLSRTKPEQLPAGILEYRAADVQDPEAVSGAVKGVDAVVHLAWTLYPLKDVARTRSIDIGGTRNVVEGMLQHGVKRLVFASSVMSYGAHADNPARLREEDPQRPNGDSPYSVHKLEAENLIGESGLDALMVRAGSVVGRRVDGITAEQFASPVMPGVKGYRNTMQFLHPEDVGRFFAQAVDAPWTGPVNLASQDTITMAEIADVLGRRYTEFPRAALEKTVGALWKTGLANIDPGSFRGLLWFPLVDTTRLADLGFRCGWTSRECVEDFARASVGKTFILGRRLPSSLPFGYSGLTVPLTSTHTQMQHASPEDVRGEFDSLVDPAIPDFTSANTSEAFPGPMSPLSLELGMDSLRTSAAVSARALGLPRDVARLVSEHPVGSFGHGIYANLSVILAMANALPGSGGASGWQAVFGDAPVKIPEVNLSARDKLRVGRRAVKALRGFGKEAARADREARSIFRSSTQLRSISDEALLGRICLTHDAVVDAWTVAANGAAFVASAVSALDRHGLASVITARAGDDELASAGALRAATELADLLRQDSLLRKDVAEAICDGPDALERLGTAHPGFVARARELLEEYGHRGPRELELTSAVYGEAPHRFLDIALKTAQRPRRTNAPPERVAAVLRPLASWGHGLHHARETARDAVVRSTHGYRLAVRERGQRLADAGVLTCADDAYYLVLDQLLRPPSDAREIVTRRLAERERLEAIHVPAIFSLTWQHDAPEAVLTFGEEIVGVGVSPGKVRGHVRVLDPTTLDDLEPGEVLVAAFTDAGWSPLFGVAAAVVTDTGGQMSHATVVAREFGVPCVVGATDASRRLSTGQLVEVDGTSGRVTVVPLEEGTL